jgi:hypothetical protein
MTRILHLTLALCFLLVGAACAQGATPVALPTAPATAAATRAPTAAPATAATTAPAGLFFVRPQGDAGPLLAYDMTGGALRFSLPPGLLSADQHRYLAAKTGADTQLLEFDLATGADTPIIQLTGQWELSAVSATGHWAALTQIPNDAERQAWTASNDWKTQVKIVDTKRGQVAQQVGLNGNFAVDTLSATGDALFLIQYLPAVKPDHYQVRWVDLMTEQLQDGALVDKRAPDEVMAGQRWQAVATRSGRWLYTLYVRTKTNTAFIHALNTEDKYTWCFDLPGLPGNSLDQLRAYTLALAPDGGTLYAANPALGLVATVDLNTLQVASAGHFAAVPSTAPPAAPFSFGVAGDRALYFSSGPQVWTFDEVTQQVKSLSTLDAPVSGLALGPEGHRLFVGLAGAAPLALDLATGQALSFQ